MPVLLMKYGLNEIKAAYSQLKASRIVLTWGEFADGIGYDRTYVSRVINGHEPLTPEFSKNVKNYVDKHKELPTEMFTPYTQSTKSLKINKPVDNQSDHVPEAVTDLIAIIKDLREEIKELKAKLSGKV